VIHAVEYLGDGSVDIVAEIAVGVETRQVRVPLGNFEGEIDPGGLRNTPVVVLGDRGLGDTVRAGASRAGDASIAQVELEDEELPGAGLLKGSSIAEVLVVVAHGPVAAAALVVARALGGRPLPVIALDDPASANAMLRHCDVDLDVAIPSVDEPMRSMLRDAVERLGLFSDHHVVEVDPRPALAERVGVGADAPSVHELTAAATGVLAGRLAAGNRLWR
jgi:hypothetical protein